jgi:glycerophosphoryl diester phosphodiesterase
MNVMRYISGLMVTGVILSCGAGRPAQETMVKTFDIEGHRGCRGLLPENTIPAMLHAIDLGVTTLEMDVVITADSQVLVSHDPFFAWEISTTPDGQTFTAKEQMSYNIYRMTAAEVAKWDVGSRPHPYFPHQQKMKVAKPLLSDLIDSVESYCKVKGKTAPHYNIETKIEEKFDGIYNPGPELFTDLVMAVVREKHIGKRVIIQSFDPRTLRIMHDKYRAIRLSFLVEDHEKRSLDEQFTDLSFRPEIYSPAYVKVDAALVTDCHARGVKVIPWTVNDKAAMERLRAMGVDGLITDYPNLVGQQSAVSGQQAD